MSVILAAAALFAFYSYARERSGAAAWQSHPLRYVLPTLSVIQLVYWAWFGSLKPLLPPTPFDWMALDIPATALNVACADYLLNHLFFFFWIDRGYRYVSREPTSRVGVLEMRALTVSACLAAGATAYAVAWVIAGNAGSIPTLVGYALRAGLRVMPLCVALLTLLALRSPNTRVRLGAVIVLGSVYVSGWMIARESSMRFMLLEPLIVSLYIWIGVNRFTVRSAFRAACVCIVMFSAFIPLAAAKHDVQLDYSLGKADEMLVFGVDRLVSRAASFQIDDLMRPGTTTHALVQDPGRSLHRVLAGLPFVTAFAPNAKENSAKLEMEIYWSSSQNVDLASSLFVAGLSELRIAWGLPLMLCAAAAAGLIHGLVAKVCIRYVSNFAWLVIVGAYSREAVSGFDAGSLFAVPTTVVMMAFVTAAVTRSIPSTSTVRSEAFKVLMSRGGVSTAAPNRPGPQPACESTV